MRVSLWPGLVRAALENQRRQQDRIRLFGHGARFVVEHGKVSEVDSLAGIAQGQRLPEQWGSSESREAEDFFDVKGDRAIAARGHGRGGRIYFRGRGAVLPASRAQRTRAARRRSVGGRASCIRAWCASWDSPRHRHCSRSMLLHCG